MDAHLAWAGRSTCPGWECGVGRGGLFRCSECDPRASCPAGHPLPVGNSAITIARPGRANPSVRVPHNVTLLNLAVLLEQLGHLSLGEARMDASHEEVRARVGRDVVVLSIGRKAAGSARSQQRNRYAPRVSLRSWPRVERRCGRETRRRRACLREGNVTHRVRGRSACRLKSQP